MKSPKLFVLLLWLLLGGSFLLPSGSTLAAIGRAGFFLMAAAHIVEFFVYLPLLRKAPGSLAFHFTNVFVFGFVHYREVRAGVESQTS
jgi:hypothetical protein